MNTIIILTVAIVLICYKVKNSVPETFKQVEYKE